MNRNPGKLSQFIDRVIKRVNLKVIQLALDDSSTKHYTSYRFPDVIFEGSLYKILLELWDNLNLDNYIEEYIDIYYQMYPVDYELTNKQINKLTKVVIQHFFNHYQFEETTYSSTPEPQVRFRARSKRDRDLADVGEAPMKIENVIGKINVGGKLYDENIVGLGLDGENLTEIPSGVFEFNHLEVLELFDNFITRIPGEIENLKSLRQLDIRNNKLSSLPEEIGELRRLKFLDVSDNELFDLPWEIQYLHSLETLDLSENQFTIFPRQITELPRLKNLLLRNNRLTSLPDEIGNLISLVELDLDDNKLTTLPMILMNLPELKEVHVKYNNISQETQDIIRTALPNVNFHF